MRTIIVGLLCLMAGAAWATSYDNAESLQALVKEYKVLKKMQALTASDIASVNCRAHLTQAYIDSLPLAQRSTAEDLPDIIVKSSDTGWNTLLSTLNTILNARVTAAKANLEALGVTNVP